MKILITGGTGFLGKALQTHLQQYNAEIIVTSRSSRNYSGVTTIQCDVLNTRQRHSLLKGSSFTHLIHAAWTVDHPSYWTDPLNHTWREASDHLFEEFFAAGGKFAFGIGSCAEYEWSSDLPLAENHPGTPSSLYGESKRAVGERLLDRFPDRAGWVRLFYLFGKFEQAGRLFPSIAEGILNHRRVPCSPGTQIRDYLSVDDAAKAISTLLIHQKCGVFNVGSGISIPLKEIITQFAHALGDASLLDIGALPLREGDPKVILADVTQLKLAGVIPPESLAGSIQTIAEWYKNNRDVS